jgi:hypothetical protein
MTTGLINSAIALIAQPRNQRYGSALPYIGKALMAGQQAGQGVYSNALQGLETQQKLAEFKRKQEQRIAQENAISQLPPEQQQMYRAFGDAAVSSILKKPERKTQTIGNQIVDITNEPKVLFTASQEVKPRATREVDAGNKVLIVDAVTGETVREIPKGLAPQAPQRASFSTVTGGDGQVYRVNSLTGQAEPVSVSGTNKPLTGATGGAKASEAEKSTAGYASRMQKAESLLDKISITSQKPTVTELGVGAISETAANALRGSERQQALQAQKDWVRAKLRKESGAAIGNQEMADEISTYFPQVGDSPDVIEQKRQARQTATQSLITSSGKAFDPYDSVNLLPKNAPMPNTGFKIRKVR